MSSSNKCTNCGSLELDTDPARGDVVCTNCGTVLEHSAIVSEVQFEENAHGGSSALGQFVSSDSKGGARGFGQTFHTGLGKESREITLQNAKKAITNLAHQLTGLSQLCIDEAFNFFKMALSRQLTRGRRSTHVIAACLYITCRVEGTTHLLIDFSDVLQIDVYELGRTYLRLSQALSLSIPVMDPCLYILRFAHRLDFGKKTQQVSMTALRLVQRMKRDSIHTGRRPSGLCGAALLIAARLHEFNRTVDDVIRVVKVHESTLRKRLMEFGETPSSALTLDEFMSVDLEEEQDPPSFKAARKKDRERLQKLMDENDMDSHVNQLQKEIERQLEDRKVRSKRFSSATASLLRSPPEGPSNPTLDPESAEADRFASQSTIGVIKDCLSNTASTSNQNTPSEGLGPSIASMGLLESTREKPIEEETEAQQTGELDLNDIDDNEIDSYIMSEQEALNKDSLWMKVNADYLKELKEKEEKAKRDQEEGKPEKKKRKPSNKKAKGNVGSSSGSAGEAVQKMLQEKKMSSKLNYDVLKNLTVDLHTDLVPVTSSRLIESKRERLESENEAVVEPPLKVIKTEKKAPRVATAIRRGKKMESAVLPILPDTPATPVTTASNPPEEADDAEDYEDMEPEEEHPDQGMSISHMLNQHRGEDDCYGGDYDYDDY
ncbi:transcription factor IIIB 90 kDa subunit [Thrips palmi]|uniref:B-related factor 1 n=1 Tax=Thrips palmi TaxID=161013 RepID=A0A6P8ZIC3_THRPL|nr:transcription factor IIIB 90 kDa subunit [Thrips palmi]XP_034233356.1 transcription factor IIIB 90 kDa subunit [Thrips palmi]XP_034233357.1 transcription factor IIIB 90 kDa subunit [Thrips palmi]